MKTGTHCLAAFFTRKVPAYFSPVKGRCKKISILWFSLTSALWVSKWRVIEKPYLSKTSVAWQLESSYKHASNSLHTVMKKHGKEHHCNTFTLMENGFNENYECISSRKRNWSIQKRELLHFKHAHFKGQFVCNFIMFVHIPCRWV